jgi:peptide/nickel transport system substrate-binding protein
MITVAACSSSQSGSTDSSTSGSTSTGTKLVTPKTGGDVTYVIATVNSRLDPAVQLLYSFSPAPVMNAIYGNLLYEDAGSTQIKMGFLKSFSTTDNGKTWTAVLRPGLKFSDGTPFNADAINYNITRAADPTLGSPFANVAKSLKLTTVDDTTLKIALPEQNLAFESIFMTDFGYVGSPTAEKAEGNADFGAKPVGAGPFKFQSTVAGQTMTLVRNPNYALFAPGQPYLDKITFQNIADYPHQSAALSAGQAQIAYATGQQGVAQLKSTPNTQFFSFQTGAGGDFIFNTAKPPFNDLRAREAITYALDRSTLGPATAAATPAQENMLTPQSPYYDKKFDLPQKDKAKAQGLFDELAADGKSLDFHFVVYAPFPDAVNGANLLVAQLSQYKNVKITLDNLTTPQALSAIHTKNFQMGTYGLYI